MSIRGTFVAEHRQEILGLVRNVEEREKSTHALNRIMAIEETDDGLRVLTTDIHLPRRIADALVDAWEGELDLHYDEGAYFVRLAWQRDD